MSQMDSNKDYVLILEKASTNLKAQVTGNDYILEGVCAVFGVENGNGRIYEENEYIPHLQYLSEKINSKRLVGELDHPKDFEVSLKNISHLVEKLEYDKSSRTVKIKVKLLDTPAGQIARSLVDAGIPVSISSRAAGTVMENKRVKIQKIFTYDLVADPGFESAQLGRVYESLGYSANTTLNESVISHLPNMNETLGLKRNSNVQIYKINDTKKIERLLKESTINKIKPGMDDNFVTSEELNQYSSLIKREFDSIKASIAQLNQSVKEGKGFAKTPKGLESRLSKLEKYADYLAENIEASIEYSDYLAENLEITNKYTNYLAENIEGSIKYAEYLAENLDHTILYSEYLGENLQKNISYAEYLAENLDMNILYAEYLAENLDKSINFSDYLAENLDKSIQFSDYLSENVNKSIVYAEYLAENLDKNITYSNYLAENLDKNIAYADYLGENLDKSINYTEYIGEKLSSNLDLTSYLEESIHGLKGVKAPLNESVKSAAKAGSRTSSYAGNYENLESKINKLIEAVEKPKTVKLDEAKKQKAVKPLNETRSFGSNMTKESEESDPSLRFISKMPKDIKPIWESLSENRKASIVSLAALYNLETDYQIDYFWRARTDLYGIKENLERQNLSSLNESQQNQTTNMPYSNEYMNSIAKALESRFKK